MPAQHSQAVLAFSWLESIGGAAGILVIVSIFAWLVHGKYFVPNFSDGNFAGVFLIGLALLLIPSPLVLAAGIGLLKGRLWGWWLSVLLYPFLLSVPLFVPYLRLRVPIIVVAVMAILSTLVLTRPGVRISFR
jgi:hypothetical protein